MDDDSMDDDSTVHELMDEIAEVTTARLWQKARAGDLKDPELKAAVAELVRPWVRARFAEGHTPGDADDIAELSAKDDLLAERSRRLFEAAYPRLLKQTIEEEIAERVSRGELVEEIGEDGGSYYRRAED